VTQNLVIELKPPRHRWDKDNERRFAGIDFPDGCSRNIRTCLHCGLKRITVIPPRSPPFPHHVWVTRDDKKWIGEATPPCISAEVTELREAS
jgi:hypothetical protein